MSQMKSSSSSSSSDNFNSSELIGTISGNLRVEYDQILNDIQHQLFFDQSLTNERRLYILNHRHTIEDEFIHFLNDRIQNLNIPSDIRDRLMANVNRFRTSFTSISTTSNISPHYPVNYDSDEESYVDDLTDDIDSDDNDISDDLENLILDEMDMDL